MLLITRRETFNAAHRLYNPKWSVEKNFEEFGICSNIHGHNWELFVTVTGNIDADKGIIIDYKVISKIVKEHIIQHIDHKYMNEDVPFLKGIMPSVENTIVAFWNILEPIFATQFGVQLKNLKLVETANHYAEYDGNL